VIVQSDEEELEVRGNLALQELERAAVDRLWQVTNSLRSAKDYSQVAEALDVALSLLRVIEYSRRIRRASGG